MSNTAPSIQIPMRVDCSSDSKRIYPDRHHWLDISCPKCCNIKGSGIDTPLFHYGLKLMGFWCPECNFEQSDIYSLDAIIDDNMVIKKSADFKGAITHVKLVKTTVSSI